MVFCMYIYIFIHNVKFSQQIKKKKVHNGIMCWSVKHTQEECNVTFRLIGPAFGELQCNITAHNPYHLAKMVM